MGVILFIVHCSIDLMDMDENIKKSNNNKGFKTPNFKSKDLYTYAYNICLVSMFNIKYKGLRIVVSDSAMRDLMNEGKTLYEVISVLEEGYDAPRQRKTGTIEKWLNKGNKTFNVVIAKDYNEIMKEDCWVLIHFGKFSRRK